MKKPVFYGLVCVRADIMRDSERWVLALGISRPKTQDPGPQTSYFFVIFKFVTVASVLCAKRMPNTPSVDFSLPAATTSAFG